MFCSSCGSEISEGACFCAQCGKRIDRQETLSPVSDGSPAVKNSSLDATKAAKAGPLPPTPCPACGNIIEGTRSTKVKCPGCGSSFHALVDPETKARKLLDDQGKRELMRRKDELKIIHKGAKLFGQYGVTKETIEQELVRLRKDGQPWTYSDAVWSLSKGLVIANIKGGTDLHNLQMIYYAQALFLEFEGRNPNGPLELSCRMRLMDLQRHFKEVRISCAGGCEACRSSNGRRLTIEEALRTHPIPNRSCTHGFEEGHYPFCRCMYEPEIR